MEQISNQFGANSPEEKVGKGKETLTRRTTGTHDAPGLKYSHEKDNKNVKKREGEG